MIKLITITTTTATTTTTTNRWVQLFNPYDLYSKCPTPIVWEEVKDYYYNLVKKYLPDKIKF